MYIVMKYVYAPLGDYYSDYWGVSYFVINYTLLTAFAIFVYLYAENTAQRWYIMLFIVHFVVLLLFYIACLFSESSSEMIFAKGEFREEVRLSLYQKAIPDKAYFNLSTIPLTIGILFIQHKLRKKSCQKDSTNGLK